MSLLYRQDAIRSRSIDEAGRKATFVAATEIGVDTWCGKEWLRMSGAKLDRFVKNPVILDSHSRWQSDCVIGRATVAVEGRQLLTTIEYAMSERAEEIWELVRTGFLRAVSVGFNPLAFHELTPGATDGEGESLVTGPGIVISQWELYEISMVPVPADEDALVRRSFFHQERNMPRKAFKNARAPISFAAAGAGAAATPPPAATPAAAPAASPPTAAPATTTRAADDSSDDEETFDLCSALKGHLGLSANASDEEIFEAVKAMTPEDDEPDGDEDESGERAAKSLKKEIVAIAPTSLREFAEGLVLEEGITRESARKRLREEFAKRSGPVGTPDGTTPPPAPAKPEMSGDAFAAAFKR